MFDHDQNAHHCPTCTCLSDVEIRARMRDLGHICIWSSEFMLNEKRGYLRTDCKICEKEK